MIRIRWKRFILLFVAIFLVVQIVGSFFIYGLAIERGPKEFLEDNVDLEVSDEAMDLYMNGSWIDWLHAQHFQRVNLASRDGLQLNGYYLPAKEPSNKVVILTHGYLGESGQMGLFGQYYHEELGYNIFLPDARGHGLSEGDYYGFGWPDRLDLIDWTHYLVEQLGEDIEVVYHGLSMGAATVLMASGEEELPQQVKAIIADSPYDSVYELFKYQFKRMFYLPSFPLLDSASLLMKMKEGYSFKTASARKEVEKTNVPILYIHGESDTFVPTEMTQDLYRHTASEAELLLIPNANHGESFALAEEAYKLSVNQFLGRYLH
ncbi:alpha/beta hydrolase [Sporosarcina ureilytica]|uniref:Alpha/beta hydrolase n=1 Tax=Sporosarcina ureilytica TaxID=298596 RepID=A0A1D8JJ24_9BACL|nr:alpha/beta hydrolase [Sporosarcina ureilytica]AOV08703.1 alpha/beta hydrolase [Sporosarcina ureilytica]